MKFSEILISSVIILVILLIIMPLSPALLDVLLVMNIALALIILLITLNVVEPLQFSSFPSLLLVLTIFRLALNLSSTRLILGNGGEAGNVIKTFGEFVIQGNIVVGFVIFLIIIAIQFIVITKGSERVAEVAARFTLDAMPGRQMAIDADLNAGVISDEEAKIRRENVQRESDFYGSMDGASKFVKGDAILAIVVTIINIAGGLIIGITSKTGSSLAEIARIYTIATIGDGLVSQLPALLISTATGIMVTRAASNLKMGEEIKSQIFSMPMPLIVTGCTLLVLSLVPGFPKLPLIIIGISLIVSGIRKMKVQGEADVKQEIDVEAEKARQRRKPEDVLSLLQVEPIELDLGYSLIPIADSSQGGDLAERIVMIRRQCALDLGLIIQPIRLRDNIQLGSNEYSLKIKGVEVARGELLADHYLAMNSSDSDVKTSGIKTTEPAFGLPAYWINEAQREEADKKGFTIVDATTVITTHITETLKKHGAELLGRQQVQNILDTVRKTQPSLVDELVPKQLSVGEVQKVLANLLSENISIRDMTTILETLIDYSAVTHDTDLLTEYVRQALKGAITQKFAPGKRARVLTLEPELEKTIIESIRKTDRGSFVSMEPQKLQNVFANLKKLIEQMVSLGNSPLVLTSPMVRGHFKKLTQQVVPELVVLSYNELEQNVEIFSDGAVSMES